MWKPGSSGSPSTWRATTFAIAAWRFGGIFCSAASPPEEEAAEIDFPDPGPSAERALLAREQLAAVESVLEKISPQQRLAFSLRFFEEMTLEEIAEAMQVEVGTVKAHLFRASVECGAGH